MSIVRVVSLSIPARRKCNSRTKLIITDKALALEVPHVFRIGPTIRSIRHLTLEFRCCRSRVRVINRSLHHVACKHLEVLWERVSFVRAISDVIGIIALRSLPIIDRESRQQEIEIVEPVVVVHGGKPVVTEILLNSHGCACALIDPYGCQLDRFGATNGYSYDLLFYRSHS